MKKNLAALCATLLFVNPLMPVLAQEPEVELAANLDYPHLDAQKHTVQEIKDYIAKHPFDYNKANTYTTQPVYSGNLNPGVLDNETLQNALNFANSIRFIAGTSEVQLDSNRTAEAQAGAFLTSSVGVVSHTPPAPNWDMSKYYDLASLGWTGCQTGLLTNYSDSIPKSIQAYLDDYGKNNEGILGHRYNFLNPSKDYVGFGAAKKSYNTYHCAVFSGDIRSGKSTQGYKVDAENYIAWPAQTQPVEYFYALNGGKAGWSFFTYDGHLTKINSVSLKDLSSNQTKTFTTSNGLSSRTTGAVFYPEVATDPGCSYEVTVNGTNKDGQSETIKYTVDFVSLDESQPSTTPSQPEQPTTPSEPATPVQSFPDVFPQDYYYDAVNWAVQNGITSGKADGRFDPLGYCTRGEIVTFLWRIAGCPDVGYVPNSFVDVPYDAYFYKPVMWAIKNGITTGKTQYIFDPGAVCTRADTMTFIYRAAGKPATKTYNAPFNDVSTQDYFYTPILWAYENGIAKGKSEERFAPLDFVTRADMVVMLNRWKG